MRRTGRSKVRPIFSSRLAREGDRLIYRVRGSGFLKHMVRNIVGVLLEAGKGNLGPADITARLEPGCKIPRDRRRRRVGCFWLTWNIKRKISMSKAIDNLQAAQRRAMALRPKVGGFPYLAETFRQAGRRNAQSLVPACMPEPVSDRGGASIDPGHPAISGTSDVPPFNREALIAALRTDQAGNGTFPEFLASCWHAGVVRYDVDFTARTCVLWLLRRRVCGGLSGGEGGVAVAQCWLRSIFTGAMCGVART